MMAGTSLALASYWGLAVLIPGLVVFGFRILDEEKMLNAGTGRLPRIHRRKCATRLVPYVW